MTRWCDTILRFDMGSDLSDSEVVITLYQAGIIRLEYRSGDENVSVDGSFVTLTLKPSDTAKFNSAAEDSFCTAQLNILTNGVRRATKPIKIKVQSNLLDEAVTVDAVETEAGAVCEYDDSIYEQYGPEIQQLEAVYSEMQGLTVQITGNAYLHIRYAEDATPSDAEMTDIPAAETAYVGFAVNATETAPVASAAYQWVRFKGTDGTDGINGVDGVDGVDGINGINGVNGVDGVGVASMTQILTSSEPGGENVFRFTLTDGRTADFTIINGGGASVASLSISEINEICEIQFVAVLTCNTDPFAAVTAISGDNTYTGQADSEGVCVLNILAAGTYAVTATLNSRTTSPVSAEIMNPGYSYVCTLPTLLFNPVPFATGTDEEIAAMLDIAKTGAKDLQNDGGWAVGDVRTIQVSAFIGGGNIPHDTQSIDIVITSFDDYNSCGAIMQFDFKDVLVRGNRMNTSNTNVGGYGSSEMYTTTLPALVNALPAWLKDRLLEFSVPVSVGNQSGTIDTVTGNKLAFRSEVEVFGTTTYSATGEGTQIPYYATDANRLKKSKQSGQYQIWWARSPKRSDSISFCYTHDSGMSNYSGASVTRCVAPFGCI